MPTWDKNVSPLSLHYDLKRCKHGTFLYNFRDTYIGRSLAVYGEYAEGTLHLLKQFLQPGDTVIEAGANIGAFTIPLAITVGPFGRVFAAEPQRLIHQLLCANLALNAVTNTVAPWCGLGASQGSMIVPDIDYTKDGNFGGVPLADSGRGDVVPIMVIDELDMSPAVIKVDVEGMELDVLLGAQATIKRRRPVLYVENNGEAESPALVSHLLEQDYRPFWHVHTLFNPKNFSNRPDNVFAGTVSCDMVCLPREAGPWVDMASAALEEITDPTTQPPYRR